MDDYYTLRAEATSIFFAVKVSVLQYLLLGSALILQARILVAHASI